MDSSPAVSPDGSVVYVGSDSYYLYAVHAANAMGKRHRGLEV